MENISVFITFDGNSKEFQNKIHNKVDNSIDISTIDYTPSRISFVLEDIVKFWGRNYGNSDIFYVKCYMRMQDLFDGMVSSGLGNVLTNWRLFDPEIVELPK